MEESEKILTGGRRPPCEPSADPEAKRTVEELRRKLTSLRQHGGAQRPFDKAPFGSEPQGRRQGRPEVLEGRRQPILYRRDIPPHSAPETRHHNPTGEQISFQDAVDGNEVISPRGENAFLVETHLGEEWRHLHKALFNTPPQEARGLSRSIVRASDLRAPGPGDLVFFDTETTGLSSMPLFLIGTMETREEGLLVRQYLARDYSEESAVIALFVASLTDKSLLVSFNGKSFDLPYIRMRGVVNGISLPDTLSHLDLLHECRRTWSDSLPDCRLQTLESRICGRARRDDIPGSEIPAAYHAFVRTGDASVIVKILRHNMLDLITMAELMTRLAFCNSQQP